MCDCPGAATVIDDWNGTRGPCRAGTATRWEPFRDAVSGPFEGVLATGVPVAERDLAAALLPGAVVEPRRLDAAVAGAHPDVRVLCVMVHDRVEPALLEGMPGLDAVVTRSDGYDHLPLAWLGDRGIAACHLPDYASDSVAELTVGLVLALLRRLPEAVVRTRGTGGALDWNRDGLVGRRLSEVTVGLVGLGRIGSRVARALTGLGGSVAGYDSVQDAGVGRLPGFEWAPTLEDLLARSDVVSLHVPLTGQTRGLIDEAAIGRMRPGACLVNTARGDVVDQAAVGSALRRGRLAGYAADVLPGEPQPPDLKLFADLPTALIVPHLGAHNHATIRRRWEDTAAACRAALERDEAALAPYRARGGDAEG